MPFAQEAFSTIGETSAVEGRTITPSDVKDCEILAVRSTRKIDAELLEGSRVRFVGTATIGTDHLDIDYFNRRGIHWCSAAGCNANSVSEYIATALLYLANRHNITLRGKTMGVIGVGNVGSKVVQKAKALGMRVLQNDPPRQRLENNQNSDFCDLDTLLAQSDIVTLHVPITKDGTDPTFHLADKKFFNKMRSGTIFMNAARGAVVNSDDLIEAIDSGQIAHTVLDTWEGEPVIREDLLRRVDIATPHIAGHSFEGKVTGTVMVYQEACRFLGLEPSWSVEPLLPPPVVPEIFLEPSKYASPEFIIWSAVTQVYDIIADDTALRAETADRKQLFDELRKKYPIRREFRFTTVEIKTNSSAELESMLEGLGFTLRKATPHE